MKRVQSCIHGLGCDVVLLMQIQTKYRFDVDKLEAEIRDRAKGNDRYVQVAPAEGETCYNLRVAYPESVDPILTIVHWIEEDVSDAKKHQRLLGLLKEAR